MKRTVTKTNGGLKLRRESIRALTPSEMAAVEGGYATITFTTLSSATIAIVVSVGVSYGLDCF